MDSNQDQSPERSLGVEAAESERKGSVVAWFESALTRQHQRSVGSRSAGSDQALENNVVAGHAGRNFVRSRGVGQKLYRPR
jgi:hypothetical protein